MMDNFNSSMVKLDYFHPNYFLFMDCLEPNFDPFPILNTERLVLRRIVEEDVYHIFKMRSDLNVMKYIGKDPAKSLDDAMELVHRINESLENNSGINWAIALKEEPNRLIGIMGIWRLIKEHFRGELGYSLLPEFWRKGIAKEALAEVLKFGFEKIGLHSVEAHIHPKNKASETLLEHAGFTRDGWFRESYYYNGVFEDTVVYSLLTRK